MTEARATLADVLQELGVYSVRVAASKCAAALAALDAHADAAGWVRARRGELLDLAGMKRRTWREAIAVLEHAELVACDPTARARTLFWVTPRARDLVASTAQVPPRYRPGTAQALPRAAGGVGGGLYRASLEGSSSSALTAEEETIPARTPEPGTLYRPGTAQIERARTAQALLAEAGRLIAQALALQVSVSARRATDDEERSDGAQGAPQAPRDPEARWEPTGHHELLGQVVAHLEERYGGRTRGAKRSAADALKVRPSYVECAAKHAVLMLLRRGVKTTAWAVFNDTLGKLRRSSGRWGGLEAGAGPGERELADVWAELRYVEGEREREAALERENAERQRALMDAARARPPAVPKPRAPRVRTIEGERAAARSRLPESAEDQVARVLGTIRSLRGSG